MCCEIHLAVKINNQKNTEFIVPSAVLSAEDEYNSLNVEEEIKMNEICVSGSPINNSNTDRTVKAVLQATGAETEFSSTCSVNDGVMIRHKGR